MPNAEPILEPDLPIVDPHHHLWDRPGAAGADLPPAQHGFETVVRMRPRYLLDELLADTGSGHNIVATVFVECGAMYRADGPAALKPVGETEFVNGVAAMSASGIYGPTRACAGIVGRADFTMGDAVTEVLEAHIAAGGGRFRGVRQSASHDADKAVLGPLARIEGGLYASDAFRSGFGRLAPLGLSFDAWLLEPQLAELVSLTRAFPETRVILDHVGTPLGLASYEGRREERFPIWREQIQALAASPNVFVKLGGLAMAFCNFPSFLADPAAPSEQLAQEWRPYIETCIEVFGPARCMFESNFPVDLGSCSYATLWNAFKRLAAGASADEKAALFSRTAAKAYRLEL
jgi:predicted TIM-barrel fold metal-dependent hydrolase